MKNREKRAAGFLVFCFVLPLVHGCFSYNMELRSFATAFSPDMYTDFTFHTRPVSPFQFGMVFSPSVPADLKTFEKGAGRKLPGNPEEWLMDSLTEKEKNEILGKMITTVTIKPTSSPLVLSDNLDLEVVVPGLKEILMKFNVGNFKTGLYVTVSADTLLHRKLNWLEVLNVLRSGQIKKEISETILQKQYVIASEELVANGYTVTIIVNRHQNPELAFAFEDAFERHLVPKSILDFAFHRTNPAVFSTKRPMAIATLWKKRPGKEDMEKIHPPPVFEHIDTWAAVQVPIKTVATMENISSEKKADSPAL